VLPASEQDQHAMQLITALAALPAGDPARAGLRQQTIQAWLPMAKRLARRYAGRGEPLDDLLQTATIGLIKSVDRYDPDRGASFIGYAIPTILGEIKRYFRDRSWSIQVPRRLQDLRAAVNEANHVLGHTLARPPTITDIAAHLHITEEQVLDALEGARAYRATSLSTPTSPHSSHQLGDCLGSEDHGYQLIDTQLSLAPAIAQLPDRERRIIMLRFYGNQTQATIAQQFGISQMHVSRILTTALTRLRTHLQPHGD
jgi:RNA polymerase sigma-B factor